MSDSRKSMLKEPWHPVPDSKAISAAIKLAELKREISPGHPLYGRAVAMLAQRYDGDGVLFEVKDSPPWFAVVQLTWSSQAETAPEFPTTEIYRSWEEFIENRVLPDAREFGAGRGGTVT